MELKKFLVLLPLLVLSGCGRDFLDVRSDMSITTPTTMEDFQAMLDNSVNIFNGNTPNVLGMIGADEFFLESPVWHALAVTNNRRQQKNAYIWADNLYELEPGFDWNAGYTKILYANLVIEGLYRLGDGDRDRPVWNNILGSALFYRASTYYALTQLFCVQYERATAQDRAGLPLRVDSDPTVRVPRSNLADTYTLIVDDLMRSVELLHGNPTYKMRPSKSAALAMLARVHLQMGNYVAALDCADQCLDMENTLLDYNQWPTPTGNFTFHTDYGQANPEVIFFSFCPTIQMLGRARMHVDPELYGLYAPDDLRRTLFFAPGTAQNICFRGSYYGGEPLFVGLTTAEVFLVRAECLARADRLAEANEDLNTLKSHRWKKGIFVPSDQFGSKHDLLLEILNERRRELVLRGLRWGDLKRLNLEPVFSKNIVRTIDDQVYTLLPNSDRYVWPIPPEVIELGGIEQNER